MNFEQPKIINQDYKKEYDKIYDAINHVSNQIIGNRLKLNAIEEKLSELEYKLSSIEKNTSAVGEFFNNLYIICFGILGYFLLKWLYHLVFG